MDECTFENWQVNRKKRPQPTQLGDVMNNNQVKRSIAFLLAVVYGAIGCSNDVTDSTTASTDLCLGCETGGASSSTTSTSGHASATNSLTASTGGTSSAPMTGVAGIPQNIAGASATGGSAIEAVGGQSATGGSSMTLVGGNSGLGGSSATGGVMILTPVGGNSTTITQCVLTGSPCMNVSECCQNPGHTMTCNGVCGILSNPTGTGGSTATTTSAGGSNATGGTTTNACLPLGATCNSSTVCCSSGNLATMCSGTCVIQLAQASGGATSTGGSTSKGGSTATGGSTIVVTGGTSSTGGATTTTTSTGGSNATGGATVVSTGGATSSTGGTASTGGTTGTGGSAVCVPYDRSTWTPSGASIPIPSPTGCVIGEDKTFPSAQYNLTRGVLGYANDNIYAAVSSYDNQAEKGSVVHWDGASWKTWGPSDFPNVSVNTGDRTPINAISAPDIGYILATGNSGTKGILHVLQPEVGTWREIGPSVAWWEVVEFSSVYAPSRNNIFLLGGGYDNAELTPFVSRGKIYMGSESGWVSMQVPQYAGPSVMNKIWGTSAKDVFAVGALLDGDRNPIKALLWHYDGCTWSDISLPNDVLNLGGVHGAGGHVMIVGMTSGSKAVRLISKDLVNWTRYDGTTQLVDTSVHMFDSTSFAIGSSHTTVEGTSVDGDARFSGLFRSNWVGPLTVDSTAMAMVGFSYISTSNTLLIAAYDGGGGQRARLYKASCQN